MKLFVRLDVVPELCSLNFNIRLYLYYYTSNPVSPQLYSTVYTVIY